MTSDYRIKIGFFRHYKTRKLEKCLGETGVLALLKLWEYAAEFRPDGDLSGMSDRSPPMLTDILKAVAVTAELTGYPLSEAALDVMVQDLAEYPEPQVIAALKRCRQECKGRLTLHQIIQRMDLGHVDHPGPEEAWGLLLRFVNDERETGLYTEPMRHAWEACDPILQAGDEVGVRMCFLETYRKALRRAVEVRQPPKWSEYGEDPERRKMALETAVERQLISADYAWSLLPAPPASLEEVAGLLECDVPREPLDHPPLRERLKTLAAQLRASQAEDVNRPIQAEQERHPVLNARKAAVPPVKTGVMNLMDARM